MIKSITANTSDRLVGSIFWAVFFIGAVFGFFFLGRLVFADYPWKEVTDIGVTLQNGGLQFDIRPFIPLEETARMIIGIAVYCFAVRVVYRQLEKRFGPLLGSGRRSRAASPSVES